jgi:hypothetical protein
MTDGQGNIHMDSIGEQIDALGCQIMAMTMYNIQKLIDDPKYKLSADADYQQTNLQKQLKYLQATYQSMKQTGRITGDDNDSRDTNLLQRIKKLQSTMGDIVVTDTTQGK